MSSTFQKDELNWRDILIRSALIIATVIIAVWVMPHDNRSYFHVEQGRPWKYADFTAPYDFPIYKSEAAIAQERDSVMRSFEPYYRLDREMELRMVEKFKADYANGIPGLPTVFVSIISNRLHSLYQQGIIEQKEYAKLHNDTTQMIHVVSGKEAANISTEEVYSPKTAYEQLFSEDQLQVVRPILQKCNLNTYIVPNLIYDAVRSETSRNDLLAGIALASGLVQKGQKIIGRGEIVTDKTYRIIESYMKENERRNEDTTQNRISILGQVMYVAILMFCFTLYLTLGLLREAPKHRHALHTHHHVRPADGTSHAQHVHPHLYPTLCDGAHLRTRIHGLPNSLHDTYYHGPRMRHHAATPL